jgi:MinD-like ATPase involved in chromosome partitioning or flagellar assembly
VADCDSGLPVVFAHPGSAVAEEFQKIAGSCRAYVEHRREFRGTHKPRIHP